MRFHWIVNPAAGRHSAVAFAERLAQRLVERGHEAVLHVTTAAGEGRRHVAALGPDACDVLGVVGGDGTLAEVLEGRAANLPGPGLPGRVDLPWPVALAPMGTANLVARELGMPLGLDVAATVAALERGVPWPVDVLAVSGPHSTRTRALANVGVGPDAVVVQRIESLRRGEGGSGNYRRWILPILDTVRTCRLPRLRVEVDGSKAYVAHACVVQNAANYGGVFRLAPKAGLATGTLDVVLLRGTTKRDLLRLIALACARNVSKDKGVRLLQADRIVIEAEEPVLFQADGDSAGSTPLEIVRLPQAVRLWRAGAS